MSLDATPGADPRLGADQIDYAWCDRQTIHVPGAILPHGALLALQPPAHTVVQASANSGEILGVPHDTLLGSPFHGLFGADDGAAIDARLAALEAEAPRAYLGRVHTRDGAACEAFAHLADGLVLLELEPLHAQPPGPTDFYGRIMGASARLQAAATVRDCLQIAVEELRALTGCDLALGFEFLEGGRGRVLAQAKSEHFASFLDKHFPASDVPEPARRQLLRVPFQYLPECDCVPVALVPAANPATGRPLDLSRALLRSVSPLCSRYYLNMGVRGKLLLTLTKDGALWGFLVCSHGAPQYLSHEQRWPP